jgi:hypothetical protein
MPFIDHSGLVHSGWTDGSSDRVHDDIADNPDFAEHDQYFQVRRVREQPAEAFLRGLVSAYSATFHNGQRMGVTTLDAGEWQQLFAGLDGILRYAAGDDARASDSVPVAPVGRQVVDGYDPEARWRIGHQLFFAILQTAIVALNCFARAVARDDERDAAAALQVAGAVMRSSAAAIKFASDFGPVDYEIWIRPAMAPPAVQAGFSGLQTRDHAYLVSMFTGLRTVAAGLRPGQVGTCFEEFVEATISAYEAHKYVCAHFGGSVLPSLRMAAASHGRTNQSGVDALRQYMRVRLFALTGDADRVRNTGPVREDLVPVREDPTPVGDRAP